MPPGLTVLHVNEAGKGAAELKVVSGLRSWRGEKQRQRGSGRGAQVYSGEAFWDQELEQANGDDFGEQRLCWPPRTSVETLSCFATAKGAQGLL